MSTVARTKQTATAPWIWLLIPAVLVVAGAYAWYTQLQSGLSVTGINQGIAWGLYIAVFFVLAGAASGLLFLAVLGGTELVPALAKHRRGLAIAAVAGFVSAGIVILMDIGHPERVLQFLFSPRLSSPFVWDFYALAGATLVGIIYIFYSPKWFAWIGGLASVAVVVAEGLLASVLVARPLWHSPLTPIVFVVEAAIAAIAVGALLFGEQKIKRFFTVTLRVMLAVLLVLFFVELATETYTIDTENGAAASLLLSGDLSTLFWAQIIGLALALVLTFVPNAGLAAVLAILAVFVAKFTLLVAGQAYQLDGALMTYAPTWVEFVGALGAVGLAGVVYILGRWLIPTKA
jgi:molybdopterin-containing oxidoreductase family membrane subunit